MKISFVEPGLFISGGIRRIIELANRLNKKGHDVTIFHTNGSQCSWMKYNGKVKSYDEILKEEHEVIIYNDPNPIDYNLVKKSEAKLKVFYVLRLYENQLLKEKSFMIYAPWNLTTLVKKKSLQSSYLKLANSTWVQNWLKENMNINSRLIIGGVNQELFYPVEVKRNKNEIRILCSGDKTSKWKGFNTILEAIKLASKEYPEIVLRTYYGKGITQEKMAEEYSSADIFIDAQWDYAGWNNPVAEAMACKVPVVCTDIGAIRDFAFNEKTALLVTPNNPKEMASAILRLIENKELRDIIRNNAYKHIQQFNWDESASELERILFDEMGKSEIKSTTQIKPDSNDSIIKLLWILNKMIFCISHPVKFINSVVKSAQEIGTKGIIHRLLRHLKY